MCWTDTASNMKCFEIMQVRGKVQFCACFAFKYAYVCYENTLEKDLVSLCLLFFSLVTLKTGVVIHVQIFLKM